MTGSIFHVYFMRVALGDVVNAQVKDACVVDARQPFAESANEVCIAEKHVDAESAIQQLTFLYNSLSDRKDGLTESEVSGLARMIDNIICELRE